MRPRVALPLALLLALGLGACNFSLAGDITPPPGSELSAGEVTPAPVDYPTGLPDPQNGAQIYTEKCAACHGDRGLGDGPQAAGLPYPPAALGDPDLAHASSPDDWFRILSAGNLDRYMPPFAGSLSTDERWDALAYVYSLSADADQAAQGQTLLRQNADALQSVFPTPQDLAELGGYSQQELATQLTDALQLSTDEAGALAIYLQGQALGISDQVAAASDAPDASGSTSVSETGGLEITGSVSNGSGGDLPQDAEVVLHGFDQTDEVVTQRVAMAADGSYQFSGVPFVDGRIYVTSVDYGGYNFYSDLYTPDNAASRAELPLTVYETTTDTGDLVVDRLHLIVEFPEAGQLRVVELVTVSNQGDRVVIPQPDGTPALRYSLPEGASNLAFEQGALGDRYVTSADGFGDLWPVLPGSDTYEILFAFEVPYGRHTDMELPMHLPVNNTAVFLADVGIELQGDNLVPAGSQPIDTSNYLTYQSTASLKTGDSLTLHLRGAHPLGTGFWLRLARDDQFIIGLLALTLAVGIAWLWLRLMRILPQRSNDLLDEIVALDAKFEAGDMARNEYRRRRAALKDALRQALEREGRLD